MHPKIDNQTYFSYENTLLIDENGQLSYVCLIQATFSISYSNRNKTHLVIKKNPLNLAGQWWGDPEISSLKFEPQIAIKKVTTDVILIGCAYSLQPNTSEIGIGLKVGPVQKIVRVFGDRYWIKTLGSYSISDPLPFERIPLIYENAFGGWDRSHPDPAKHTFESRNPVGTGFRRWPGKPDERIKLPNLEDPKHLIRHFGDTPPPAGFGFISPNWQPRAALAGTYDENWQKTRMPLLPLDFDRRFFNAASPGLIAPDYLKGDEAVVIVNAAPVESVTINGIARRRLEFNLPGVPPPRCEVELRGAREELLETRLDTVIINTDESLLMMLWRAHVAVRNGPHDVVAVRIWTEDSGAESH